MLEPRSAEISDASETVRRAPRPRGLEAPVTGTSFDLTGRRAIVTGAGSGIGRAIAVSLAVSGATVIAADIDAAAADATVEAIRASGTAANSELADVCSEDDVERLVADAGNIDILCNNVGVIDDFALPDRMSLATWERVLRINLTSQFLLCRAVLPGMVARRTGAIINISSEAGIRGGAAGVAYTASKHGVIGLTRSLAYTYIDQGVRTNAICPGGVSGTNIGQWGTRDADGVHRLSRVRALIGDLHGTSNQIASVAAFLASDAASFVNGAIIPVDGGWSAA